MTKPDSDGMRIANIAPFGLRLRPELKGRIEAAARSNGRSMNSEIAARLEWSLGQDEEPKRSALQAMQTSPAIRMEKRLIAVEAQLESRIDQLESRLAALETELEKPR